MGTSDADPSIEDLIGDSIPQTPTKPVSEPVDVSAPWYRPAKQYLRRQQWNQDILHLLNRLPSNTGGPTMIKYVGLPGQHYLDVLSMGRLCYAKNLIVDYLGFRTGDGAGAQPESLDELSILSNHTYFTKESKTYPDSINNIGRSNSIATAVYNSRGPFDVVNLDVRGGLLHGNTTPLLQAIKYVLTTQVERTNPWLLFVTTIAKPNEIADDILAKFFMAVSANCEKLANFDQKLSDITTKRFGASAKEVLRKPGELPQDGFLRMFTLSFGKWLLSNLDSTNPRAVVTLRSVYGFRNTEREDAEMLSLAYLISPAASGGDPTGLTGDGIPSAAEQYSEFALGLVESSIEGVIDLDQTWHTDAKIRELVIKECEALLQAIGVDDEGIAKWHAKHFGNADSQLN
jgi:hypothetical protein